MKPLAETTVAVVGLGLMGGSLAGALRGRCRSVVGVARRDESVEIGLAHRLIDRGTTDLENGVRRADVVILATPVRVILQQLTAMGALLPTGCLLMDLGSTKAHIVAAMADLPSHIEPLGAHPMCGREDSGIEAADPALFRDSVFVLTPLARTSKEAVTLGCALVEAVGARPLVFDPDRHDWLVALVSHLPYLLACALVGTVNEAAADDQAAWHVASSGFRDTSRLAASDVAMMLDILLTNQEAVLKALRACEAQMRDLGHLIERGDEDSLRSALHTVRERRRRISA